MARRSSTMVSMSTVGGIIGNKGVHARTSNDLTSSSHAMSSQDEQRYQAYLDRARLLTAKVERCVQELMERVQKVSPSLTFDLLAPPASHLATYFPIENKEFYFDFYLVWKKAGQIQVERDASSVCCTIKYLDRNSPWSRAEQARFLLSNMDKKKSSFVNGRGLRDLLFETLYRIAPDLIRLDFVEHLIYFDLIVPSGAEKSTCHVSLLPCVHLPTENEVLLPFGTLRWYPRSLEPIKDKSSVLSFQQPMQNISIRHYISTGQAIDETTKITKKDHQDYARARTIIHELLLPTTLAQVDCVDQLRAPFDSAKTGKSTVFFIAHLSDRNCNVFPAGQHLVEDLRARRFFRDCVLANMRVPLSEHAENHTSKLWYWLSVWFLFEI